MSILQKLEKFVKDVFKTTIEIFFEALKLSPNAQGYVSGSITELLLKQMLENYGYEVKRIREKWEGKKLSRHHGDFYFRKPNQSWFVLESKGIKSNSEKWHKLYNYDKLRTFFYTHHNKISWINPDQDVVSQIVNWINENLPKFQNEFKSTLYDYEEIKKYLKNEPKKETEKLKAIKFLKDYSREEINRMIEERLEYVMSKIKVLETHFVSGISGSNERTQATPRKDEFNLISIDIFLRYKEHKFIFANPQHLDSSGADAEHLQQNYIMGFVFSDDNNSKLNLSDEWYENFEDAFETLSIEDAIKDEEMQVDNRNLILNENQSFD